MSVIPARAGCICSLKAAILLHVDADAGDDARAEGENLAALIKRSLGDAGRTQSWLAQESGIPLATINAWWTGRRTTGDPDRLRALAEVLPGVTVAEVFAAGGRRAPAALDEERERKLLRLYRELPVDQQRMLVQQAELLAKMSRAS